MTISPFPRRAVPKPEPRVKRAKNAGEGRTRQLVAARSGGWCEACGIMRAASVHHRRKRSQGGPWSPSNCVHVCGDGTRGCHGWVEANPNDAAEVGLHIRAGEVPAEVPLISGYHGAVLLDDEGGITPVGGES